MGIAEMNDNAIMNELKICEHFLHDKLHNITTQKSPVSLNRPAGLVYYHATS